MLSLAQRRHALQAATELLNEIDVDQESPIDVFEIIERLDLFLVFVPLKGLLGATVPKGDGGIMLSTQRRPAIQRYTAAHEIGHWILDVGQLAFDTDDDIFYPSADRERLAQLFAGQLLMPPPLVFAKCARYGISASSRPTARAVYEVARDMGSSYEAAARQMANLGIISGSELSQLLSVQPSRIKQAICHGHRPVGVADVWPVDHASNDGRIQVTEGDELFVALPENRTTGYRWLSAEQVHARAERRIAEAPPAPAPSEADSIPLTPIHEHLAQSRTAAGVKRALSRVPGDSGASATLRHRVPQTQHVPGFEARVQLDAAQTRSLTDTPVATVESPRLEPLEDRYEAGWAAVSASEIRAVRRTIAGRNDVALPGSVSPYMAQSNPPTPPESARPLFPASIPVASTGQRLVALRTGGEGNFSLDLYYTSGFNPQAPVVERYHLDVLIVPAPQIQHRRKLLANLPPEDATGEA